MKETELDIQLEDNNILDIAIDEIIDIKIDEVQEISIKQFQNNPIESYITYQSANW